MEILMKKTLSFICFLVISLTLLLSSCSKKKENAPEDGLYAKNSSANQVIDIKFEKKTFEGDGEIRAGATVGFGRLPELEGDMDEMLRVEYLVISTPWAQDKRPTWEMETDYLVSWYDEMFDAAVTDGELAPVFREDVTLTFPAEVDEGYLEIILYTVKEGHDKVQIASLILSFERKDGVLTISK